MSADARILFLRGINVGGRNRLLMADLRALLAGLGLEGVKTHIQSGNAVFFAPPGAVDLGPRIGTAIEGQCGFRPAVIVLTAAALADVLAANPFAAAGADAGATVHIGFLAQAAVGADPQVLAAFATTDERFALTEAAFYLHAPSGIGRSKLAAVAERALAVPMTMRNQRVVEAVAALALTRGGMEC